MISARPFEKNLFYLILAIFIVGGLLRAFFVDFSDFDYGIYSDHFINAVTAKNISIGLHWSSSGYETYLLNPENLTTGPTIVLPVAASVAVFGNTFTAPGTAIFLLNTVLLLLFFNSLKKSFDDDRQFYLGAFLLVFLFIFFKSYYWYRMIGEVSAILLLLLVVTHLSQYLRNFNKQSLVVASVASTFAMGAKELVLLPILMLTLIVILVSFFSRAGRGWSFWLGRPLLFLSISFAFLLCFFLYQHALLQTQTESWRSAYFAYANGIHDYYSGINTLREYFSSPEQALSIFKRVFKSTLWNGGTLLHLSFAGMRGLQYWLYIFTLLLTYIFITRKFSSLHGLLGFAALPLLLWYFCISEKAMPRHLFIGLCLAVIAMLFYIVSIKNRLLRYIAASLAASLIILTGDQSSRNVLASWPIRTTPNIIAAQDIQRRIERLPPKSLGWFGMIDNNEFEYVSNVPNNFFNAFDQIADSITLDENAYLVTHPQLKSLIESHRYQSAFDFYRSPDNTHQEIVKVNFTKPVEFDWIHFKNDIAQFHRAGRHLNQGNICKTILYQNEYYLIEHCTTKDIQAFLDKMGGLQVRPRKWRPYILLPTERIEIF